MTAHNQYKNPDTETVRHPHPFRTAVASATVAGMMKNELADTAS